MVWIVPNYGGELHPAFVIRISSDRLHALVLSGTGTGPRDYEHLVVEPHLRRNKKLRLSKTTYFYARAAHVRAISEIVVRSASPITFPIDDWERLRQLAFNGSKAKLSEGDFAEWWPKGEP